MNANHVSVRFACTAVCAAALVAALDASAQTSSGGPSGGSSPEPKTWTTAEDHADMLARLGIRALRPGPSGNEQAPNHANYDESLADPFPVLPDPLTLASGKKVKSARVWWSERRPEIVEDFEREVLGRVPSTAPAVAWSVAETREWQVGSQRVIGRQLVGRVDNSAYPAISVEICMTLVTPADAKGPVPVMIMLGG